MEQHLLACQSTLTANELSTLEAALLESAQRHRKARDANLLEKFKKINPPKRQTSGKNLVHNLSSHRLTELQLAVLSYNAKFNRSDAQTEDFIASFESAPQKCEADEECKNAMRQQVSSLLLQHKRQVTISASDAQEGLRIRKMKDIVSVPGGLSLVSQWTDQSLTAALESLLLTSSIPEDMRADIRSCATGLLRKRKHQKTLPMEEEKRLRSLRSNDSIAVVAADRGGATVIMDKIDYVNRANQAFHNREAYIPIAEDPMKKQTASVKKKVNELTRLKLISPADSKFLTLNDPHIARAYVLPKIHKADASLRIIVPLIGLPTCNLAKWLYKH
ncbi:unnamed protein product [Schistocephalus solidus]|uniref:Uncharacterized protein n=1 Tax=Schistocephalus solidus TaxID=70667 RepID=A0A183SJZ9_SCHSO|nr:unnamed protein product [Schistocephalus solidus]